MKKKVKIAGAGLSGFVAGISLLEAGYEVLIYEKEKDVGERFSNDFQNIANWLGRFDIIDFFKEIGIRPNFFIKPVKKGTLFGPGLKEKAKLRSRKPLFYLIKRGAEEGCLDVGLKKQFIEKGGEIYFNNPAPEKIDICATGPDKINLMSFGFNFKADFGDGSYIILDNNLAPKAYAYLTIEGGRGSMATVLSEDFKNKENYLQKTKNTLEKKLNIKLDDKKPFLGFADFSLSKPYQKKGVIYTGEACGLQDAHVGLGMYFAIRSGYLAAESIVSGDDYSKICEEEFEPLLKTTLVNRSLVNLTGNTGYNYLLNFLNKKNPDLRSRIKKEYEFNLAKKMIYPLARFFTTY